MDGSHFHVVAITGLNTGFVQANGSASFDSHEAARAHLITSLREAHADPEHLRVHGAGDKCPLLTLAETVETVNEQHAVFTTHGMAVLVHECTQAGDTACYEAFFSDRLPGIVTEYTKQAYPNLRIAAMVPVEMETDDSLTHPGMYL